MDFYKKPEDGTGRKIFKISSGFLAGLTLTYLATFSRITRPYMSMRNFEYDNKWYETIYRFGADYLTLYTEYGISGFFKNDEDSFSVGKDEDLRSIDEYLEGKD